MTKIKDLDTEEIRRRGDGSAMIKELVRVAAIAPKGRARLRKAHKRINENTFHPRKWMTKYGESKYVRPEGNFRSLAAHFLLDDEYEYAQRCYDRDCVTPVQDECQEILSQDFCDLCHDEVSMRIQAYIGADGIKKIIAKVYKEQFGKDL